MPSSSLVKFVKKMKQQQTLSDRQITLIIERHPILREDVRLRRLFIWLARECHWKDKESGNILLPYQLLAEIMGATKGNCNTLSLLQLFKEKVAPEFTWKEYYAQGNKCRQVVNSGITELAEQLISMQEGETRMYIENLEISTEKGLQTGSKELRELSRTFTYPYEDQEKIARYLHNLPLHLFYDPLKTNFTNTLIEAAKQKDVRKCMDLLSNIRDMPLPFYFASRRVDSISPRLFSYSTPMLPKAVRRVLYPDWVDLDLRNCQLAIAGGIFDIDPLQERLSRNQSIWPELLTYMGLREEQKGILKQGLYSLVYGMDESVIERNITIELADFNIQKKRKFLDYHLLKTTNNALNTAKERIIREKGFRGAYGKMPFDPSTQEINSFLSCLIQTYELSIVSSAYDAVIASGKGSAKLCDIVLHQHDGISILLPPTKSKDQVIKRMNKAIVHKAIHFGIFTLLA